MLVWNLASERILLLCLSLTLSHFTSFGHHVPPRDCKVVHRVSLQTVYQHLSMKVDITIVLPHFTLEYIDTSVNVGLRKGLGIGEQNVISLSDGRLQCVLERHH